MEKTWLVMDIETFAEEAGQEGATAGAGGGEGQVQGGGAKGQAAGKSFPPAHLHRVIAIGYLLLGEKGEMRKLGVLGEGRDEKAILEDFHRSMTGRLPWLVTYNGRKFDVPVILLRSLKHGLSMEWYFRAHGGLYYDRRYPPTKHLDLCDALSEHGAASFASLDAVSSLLGLRGKTGMDGGMVQEEFLKGNIVKIENYCLSDVLLTACVFLRTMLLMGELSSAAHNAAIDSLVEGIRGDARVADFLAEQDPGRLKV